MSLSPSPDPEALLAHAGWVRGLARSLVVDPSHADDVEQEVWLDALERPPGHGRNPRAWLGRVAHNAARQLGRRDGRRRRREERAPAPEVPPAPAELVEQAEVHRALVSAVLALDELARTTILLRYWRGLPPR